MLGPGDVVAGRYQLVRLAGTGGTSRVWEALDLSLKARIVAVKELPVPAIGRDEARRVRALFHRETDVLTRLSHAGLPAIYDGLAEDDACYLVLEFVEGCTLEAWRERHVPDITEVVEQGCEIAAILEYLHTREESLVVRDLKPSNVIRGAAGRLRLVDLGIAAILRPDAAGVVTMAGYGTPGFAAPEQYGRQEVDVRTDLYALGATLYFLLTGEAPPDAIDRLLGRQVVAPIVAVRPDCPAELARCIERGLLALDAAERPSSAAAVAEWLRRSLHAGDSAASRQGQRARLGDPHDVRERGGRILWMAYAASGRQLLAASPDDGLLITDGISLQAHDTGARISSVACSPTEALAAVASPESTIVLWSADGSSRMLRDVPRGVACVAFSPDGATLAAGLWDKSIRLWDLATGQGGRSLLGHTGAIAAIVFSPDGRSIASASADRSVRVWSLANGTCTHVLQAHHGPVHAVCFVGDSGRLASASRDRTVAVWNVPTTVLLHRLRGHTSGASAVCSTPDGTLLASAGWDGAVRLWDPSSGHCLDTATIEGDAISALACSPNGNELACGTRGGRLRIYYFGGRILPRK